jgi:hypothetical protein
MIREQVKSIYTVHDGFILVIEGREIFTLEG